ncbi:hypothetical protein B0H16DRAFT_1693953 [Mycena metata]|uniref:C2H2-type domain-containing protein n=1 Tax=Mycena metata TaxID=1033252 RepID=A0AAD7N2J8_9AGAR|nr:hypothetical protein B0H16DRAFT_1693953 [Mycena metata]
MSSPAVLSTSTPATTRRSRTTSTISNAKKQHHICPVCQRPFSTTGHLARHSRVHTGERNHKCPFPGCETRCSRADNLQQHYRIHLSPGSRRKSGRTILRSESTPAPSPLATSPSSSTDNLHGYREDSPPLEPPPLEDSRLYFFNVANGGAIESPPNTPPPLVEAFPMAYRSEIRSSVGHPYPTPTHRSLPQIDTSARVDPAGEEYWSTSSMSDSHGNASNFPSPSAYPSSNASTYPSPSAQYSSGLPQYVTSPQSHHHPHVFRHASHSPAAAAVPVARSLTARHSIAHLGAHAQRQRAEPPRILQMDDGRVLHHPVASHQPMPRQQQEQEQYPSASPSTTYTAPQVVAAAPYAGESYTQVVEQRPESPSPPPSSQHSPQTPYTPFHEPVAVYAPVPSQYPPEQQRQYEPIHRDVHGAYAAHTSQQQHHYATGYPEAPHQQQPAPYADGRVVNLTYGAVLPVMQYHTQEQQKAAYDKQQQRPGVPAYMDEHRTYSPAVLPADLPALRRESVGGNTYVAGAETQTVVASSSLAGAGYIPREGAGQYIQHSATPPPQQPPLSGEYLAHYEWRVAEVQ